MKKNILSIVMIVLIGLNVVLTALIVFTIVPSLNKVNTLITDISTIVQIEKKEQGGEKEETLSLEDKEVYTIDKTSNIYLKKGTDNKQHYAALDTISITINKTKEDYEKIMSVLPSYETKIEEIVNDTIASYTIEDANNKREIVREKITEKLNTEFNSEAIITVSLGNLRFQ